MQQTEKRQIGRYEILEEIGRGAMGVVFKARDPLIGRSVAVKTITAGVAESADLLDRFYREARAAGGLQHPNIVTIYELAQSGGAPFIAMEYLEGESLEKLIARRPALSLGAKVNYVVQTCRALDYAHRRGVIHRDVKPANIVLTADGMVKVVDFGIARIADTSKTQTGMLLGALAYMSPEQLRGRHADARCDIWALGVVLYELVAYQRPFSGENHAALLLSILQNEPPPMRQLIPECPIQLERVISRALRKDGKERYPTMEALLKDLESVSASSGRTTLPAPLGAETPSTVGGETLAATQRIDVQPLNRPDAGSAKTSAPPRRATQPTPAPPAARQPAARPSMQPIQAKAQIARRKGRWGGKALAIFTVLALGLIAVFAAVRYHKRISAALNPVSAPNVVLPAQNPPAASSSAAGPSASILPVAPSEPTTPASTSAPTAAAPVAAVAAKPSPAPSAEPTSPAPSGPSLEDQQRRLIDLAHEAADQHDYKAAQKHLDEAANLKGPLNGLVSDLRRQFSEEAHGAELRRAARREQTLWDQATADLQAGHLDDSERSFRAILTLPEGGHRWADVEHYIDQVIPERRREDQLWSAAQLDSTSQEPGHFLKEVKSLDDLLTAGGPHQQQAREMRDAVFLQMARGNARRNRMAMQAVSPGDESQIAQLKNQYNDLVEKGDAAALKQFQQLRPKFKAIADAQGPLAADARDYLNNLIPKAEKHIEDNLAAAESQASANAAYQSAVEEFDRAVATRNQAMLQDEVLPLFSQMAQSGGVRAKEARQYSDVLIPAALKKSGPQE